MTQRLLDPRMFNTAQALPAMSGANLTNVNGLWQYVSASTSLSGSGDADFTGMEAGYDYHYVLENIIPGTDAVTLYFLLGTDAAWRASTGYYSHIGQINGSGTSSQANTANGGTAVLVSGETLGTGSNEKLQRAEITLTNPAEATTKTSWNGLLKNYGSTPDHMDGVLGGEYATAEAHTRLRFQLSSGNYASGSIYVYRRKRS